MVGAPRSGWLERWGELAILLTVWLLAAAATWGLSRVSSLRQAFRLRALADSAIAKVIEGKPAVARVRGRVVDPGMGSAGPGTIKLEDETGSLLIEGQLPHPAASGGGPVLAEAVGCYQGARLVACDALPLLVGTPTELHAAQRERVRAAALKLALVLAILCAIVYVAGRLLGAPLGRRLPGKRTS